MNKLQKVGYGVVAGVGAFLTLAVSTFAQTPYQVNPTDAAAINNMTTGATSSFLSLFESNWPSIVTLAITIIGFFFIWRLIKGMLSNHH